jgi:hypothetical protein
MVNFLLFSIYDQLSSFICWNRRAPKVKYLKYIYRPWTESWKEIYRQEEDDLIYLYR